MPLTIRTRAQARRWRYSHGEMMSRMPDRGGAVHHARRPLDAVLLLGAGIGPSPNHMLVGRSTIYQYDITSIFDRPDSYCNGFARDLEPARGSGR